MSKRITFLITAVVLGMVAGTAMGKLVAYYPLDEGTGTTIIDASENGHNGTVENGPATWIDAQLGFGKALFFDGSNPAKGYVNCGTWNPSSATGRLSIAFWVQYAGTNPNWQGVIAKRDNWDPAASPPMMWYIECNQSTGAMGLATRDNYPAGVGTPPTGQWAHVAFTFDGTTVRSYLDGVEVGSGAFAFGPKTDATIFIGCDNGGGYNGFNGAIDDVRIYDNALTADEVRASMVPGSGPKSASSARPADGATDVPRDTVLSWKPGKYAVTHDVYFGTVKEEVAAADVTSSLLVSQGQDANTFDPTITLSYGTTYYWRVDEVNAAPDSSVFKGDVWSFTAEPYAYTITGVTATASSAATNMPASKTVDGSGLNADGQHSVTDADGWLTAAQTKLPGWIRFDFGRAYTLQTMHVWNSNQRMEPIVGFGAQTVLIEYSVDGTTWTALDTMEFPKADGTATYAGFDVDMGNVLASSVRLTIQKNWSPYPTLQQVGLAEVRFTYIPFQAREPDPATDATGVPIDVTLRWREGRKAASHEVYLNTDQQAVLDGVTPTATTTEHSFQPSALSFGQLYYWKVNEVNEADSWPGELWSFTTAEFTDIDNFESYTNDSPDRVFQTWIDGLGFSPDDFFPSGNPGNGSGALVGYDPTLGAVMETSIVHGGTQSMPVEYNNVNPPYYSEIDRTWATPQDWTTNGATDLGLWFRGNPAAILETASGIRLSGAGSDIYNGIDEFRFAYKKLSGDGSITVRLDSVQALADWTKTGVMIRETLDPLAVQVHIIAAAQQQLVEWQYRSAANSSTTTQFNTTAGSNPLPVWLRLTRAGNVFTGEYSADGKTWSKIDASATVSSSETVYMNTSVYIGMVVCSHVANRLAVADFSNIKLTGNVTGQWQTADITVAQGANKPDPLYLVLQDSSNKSVTLTHPDGANAVLVNEWTQWKIPLSQLAGVNAKAIKKMTIGVGDKSNPKAGAAGRLFIDDIQYGRPVAP